MLLVLFAVAVLARPRHSEDSVRTRHSEASLAGVLEALLAGGKARKGVEAGGQLRPKPIVRNQENCWGYCIKDSLSRVSRKARRGVEAGGQLRPKPIVRNPENCWGHCIKDSEDSLSRDLEALLAGGKARRGVEAGGQLRPKPIVRNQEN